MKYTVQFIIAGYGLPDGKNVEHYNSLQGIKDGLLFEHERAEQYGAAYEPSEAVIFKGRYKDVTDMYPDKVMTVGPRGGVRVGGC